MKAYGSSALRGFTLIEVSVALLILSLVLGGAVSMVQQYADERIRLRERFFSNSVGWSRLMQRYQHAQGWVAVNEGSDGATQGVDEQAGQDWRWRMKVEAAMGKDFYRYEVRVGLAGSEATNTALSIYLIGKP
jgi:type II secretion system protein I